MSSMRLSGAHAPFVHNLWLPTRRRATAPHPWSLPSGGPRIFGALSYINRGGFVPPHLRRR
jgi:hypothetical protein